ncbi:MAG: hypothetical protein K1X82_07895 [Bacteroidia bacterium]|nr:hypothetical protein [Bacteroidia bacterium]
MTSFQHIYDIFSRRPSCWTLIFLFFSCFDTIGQTTFSLDTIKDDKISIDPDYNTFILNPDGWKHYANYYYSNDSLALSDIDCIDKYKKCGKLEMVFKFNGSDLIGHAKYKLRKNKIGIFPAKELRGKRMVKFVWTYNKIIKMRKTYFITESNFKNIKVRHVFIINRSAYISGKEQ